MKSHPDFLRSVAILLVVLMVTSGCFTTREVWADRYYHAHAQPQVQLAASPERPLILVKYREQFEKSNYIRWRAFWLDLTETYDPFTRPQFVDPAGYPGLIPIPMLGITQGTNTIPTIGYAAMETYNKPGFELWKDGELLGRFRLPAYHGNAPLTTETIAKTPIALLIDAGIIVLGAAAVVAILYLAANSD